MRRYRISIGKLMGIVLVSAVGFAGLRDASGFSLGVIYLLTRSILGLAVLQAIYQRGAARAWWLGFAMFGWGYEYLVPPTSVYRSPHMPAATLLIALKPLFGRPAELVLGAFSGLGKKGLGDYAYLRIGDDLLAMVIALLGGVLARMAFERSSAGTEPDPPPPSVPSARSRWFRPTIAVWAAMVLTTSVVAIRSTWTAGFWAGLAFLLVFGLLGLAAVGAFQARGRPRRSCTGAARLGGGYLLLVFSHSPYPPMPSGQFLHAFRVWIPGLAGPTAAASARILEELERPVEMTFPDPTPLKGVLQYVTMATSAPDYPGIPIYLDPVGLQEAEQSPESKITIDLRGIPLKVTLRAALRQLGMAYVVTDGFPRVTSTDSYDFQVDQDPFDTGGREPLHHDQFQHRQASLWLSADLEDPYLIVGHCLLAMLMAGLGAAIGPIVAETAARVPT